MSEIINQYADIPLPGKQEALILGYSLYSHSGDHKTATYMKDGVSLDIWYSEDGLMARLSFNHSLIVVSTFGAQGFSFPHPLFGLFEQRILDVKGVMLGTERRGEPF